MGLLLILRDGRLESKFFSGLSFTMYVTEIISETIHEYES
jgi:hypothetical protein